MVSEVKCEMRMPDVLDIHVDVSEEVSACIDGQMVLI